MEWLIPAIDGMVLGMLQSDMLVEGEVENIIEGIIENIVGSHTDNHTEKHTEKQLYLSYSLYKKFLLVRQEGKRQVRLSQNYRI
ncbi:MAG: hypothetical protein IKQ59_06690 [Prevotella sp.]|nr:hypothetical protein [Prevotella sp.]